MAYKKDVNYQEEIDKAVGRGDYNAAAQYEKERNEKIDGEKLDYEKTYNYTTINGVNGSTNNKINSSFSQSNDSKNADNTNKNALNKATTQLSKSEIVNSDVYDILGSQFQVPAEVTQADIYLKEQLEKIQSGKTSYTDQIKDMMDKITNREKFSYDVDTDPLFQQALASAMKSGNQAMQDTIGQASTLTGGYGSTYATSAGNQAYNSFIEDAYDNLPQYYQMALEAYQLEGEEMYRQLDMFNSADDKEYGRYVTAYDATSQYRNRAYDEAYSIFRDSKADALSMANLQLAEHGQLSSDAYNLFNATSNYADTLYQREYNSWMDSINVALQQAQMQNSDYWNKTNFDEGVRQYEKNFEESQKQFDKTYEQTEKWNQAEMDYKNAALKQDNEQFYANLNYQKSKGSGGGGGDGYYASATQKAEALEAYVNGGTEALKAWGASQKGGMNKDEIMEYVESQSVPQGTTIKKTENTWNGFLGIGGLTGRIDPDDEYEVTYPGEAPKTVKAADLPEAVRSRIDDLKKGQSITW